jgi:asparagine synthase (glutamine-hydrolysing)
MCGIAGIVACDGRAVVDPALIQRMCRTIIHRGPDDDGFYAKDGVTLGMRRLSIIDLSTGHQPISNEDGSVWVVLNGEIYNFQELRTELERAGHRFSTRSDTEVICHLYEDLGAECVKKLRGMFAFAVYDERRRRLLLARDRMGEKPLHYAQVNGCLIFGSEIKELLAAAPELSQVSPENLLYYFQVGYIPDPLTAFSAIRKLPPGCSLELADGHVEVRRYWDLPAYGTHESKSEEQALEEMEHHLAEAVRIQMVSDVPLGALLSGGVDSSTVVALMARASSRPVKTFSIGFRHADFNETAYARAVAERFSTEHHELILEPNIGETLENLTHVLEEPFADSSILPTYFVSCLAREHVTVALAGDGGDELFAGYDRHQVNVRRRFFDHIPPWAGRWYLQHVYPQLPRRIRARKFAYNIALPSRERYLDGISFLSAQGRDRGLFTDDFLARAQSASSPLEMFRGYFDSAVAGDPLSPLLYLDAKTYLPADILTKVDRMSMATSLEVRAPLLDPVFVEWATSLPPHWKLRGKTRKYLLKKLAERVGVPRHVLHRRKQGFSLPLVHWIRSELKEGMLRMLLEPRTVQRGYFNPDEVRRLLEEHIRGQHDWSAQLWMLLMFEFWHRNFLETRDGYKKLPIHSGPAWARRRELPVEGPAASTRLAKSPSP